MHDIGKLGIPDSILLKAGPLNDEEWGLMREHTTIGANLCNSLATMKLVVPIIQYHHERWDGSGYPHKLKGEDIPLLARIFQIADIYDALASERPYKNALDNAEIIAVLKEETAKGWRDPILMANFIDLLQTNPELLLLTDSALRTKDQLIFESILETGVLEWDKNKKY
jgi:putative two-component system response regulator